MTIKEFADKINAWPYDEMDFCITDVFSWRGVYAEPCCSLSTQRTTKQENLDMLNRLVTDTFYGYKGGEFKYDDWQDINFEECYRAWSDGKYLIQFIINNNTDIVKHIFKDNEY